MINPDEKKPALDNYDEVANHPTSCRDCGAALNPARMEYKLRRNSKEHKWEPICMDCWKRLVLRQGGMFGNLTVDFEKGKVGVKIDHLPTSCCRECTECKCFEDDDIYSDRGDRYYCVSPTGLILIGDSNDIDDLPGWCPLYTPKVKEVSDG